MVTRSKSKSSKRRSLTNVGGADGTEVGNGFDVDDGVLSVGEVGSGECNGGMDEGEGARWHGRR